MGPSEFKITPVDLPHTTLSYHKHMCMEVIRDIKESICRVSESPFDPTANTNIPYVSYELPDGTKIEVGSERFTVPERLFIPDFEVKDELDSGNQYRGLPKMIWSSVDACDVDIKKELYQAIILTGGNTLYPGLSTRLQKEIVKLVPPAFKTKLIQSTSKSERKFGIWTGGSILGSLGSFQQMWFSKQEYEEHGASLLQRKCP